MINQPQLDALIAHIEQRRHSADRETIRLQLLQAGVESRLLEEALARVYDAPPAAQPVPAANQTTGHTGTIEQIKTYLEQNRRVYDRQALRQKLVADGHDPHTVDLAMAQVYGFQVAPTNRVEPLSTRAVVLTALGVFVLNYAAWVVILGLAAQFDMTIGLAVPIMLLLEGVAAFTLRRTNRSMSRGLAWGIAGSLLPVVGLALLFGICLAILGTGY